ncbi:MAG TPA: TetR/AcrR family transcriptional regulator [Kofleriaceae bacterium]|nr:TetR/AcrR family transcriptional regulator [Kofleriaceae bacterium]
MPPGRVARSARGDARPRRRIRLDNDQRRAQLLALARRAFSDRAYDEVSIDDLARGAGISKGLLYHYFPTKRDLYVAGLREIADELVDAVTHVAEDLPPSDRVRAAVDAYLEHVARQSRAFVALMRGGIGSDPEVAAVVDSVRTRVFDNFASGSSLATVLAGDARLETAVRGWIGFVEAASIDWCANPRLSRPELRDLITAVLLEILRVAAPAGFEPG